MHQIESLYNDTRMRRSAVGSVTAVLASAILHPLDTRKVLCQYVGNAPSIIKNDYAGLRIATLGKSIATWVHFEVYDGLIEHCRPLAVITSVVFSSTIESTCNVLKRRRQAEQNLPRIRFPPLTFHTVLLEYNLLVTKNLPKAMCKSAVYEIMMTHVLAKVTIMAARGALSAAVAAFICTLLFMPFDHFRVNISNRSAFELFRAYCRNPSQMFSGWKEASVQSIVENGIGYAIVDGISPRHVGGHAYKKMA
jgi:hypothetical protein